MSQELERSTLVGVATGSPDGGVSIVRLSGPQAIAIATGLCGDLPPARRLARRRVCGDDGLAVVLPGPGSYTGEDTVELHVHSGARNVAGIVEACLRGGATAAGSGDFTRRAFEHGRLSLDQAEGVAAVIGAQTDEALHQARRLVAGDLGREVATVCEAIAALRAEVEANLDFPEDVESTHVRRWRDEVADLRSTVRGWLERFERGRRARSRARVVLAGPPNAGKSSLFNALLQRRRAIVADRPGTTRDYVEAELRVGRFECTLVDTAGLHGGADEIERAGVAFSEDQLDGADLVIWVEAADSAATNAAPAGAVKVEAKRDLGQRRASWLGVTLLEPVVGLAALRDAIERWFDDGQVAGWIGLARHRDAAAAADAALGETADRLGSADALELAAFDLSVAEGRLGQITGRTPQGPINAELLDRIFSTFCIGK